MPSNDNHPVTFDDAIVCIQHHVRYGEQLKRDWRRFRGPVSIANWREIVRRVHQLRSLRNDILRHEAHWRRSWRTRRQQQHILMRELKQRTETLPFCFMEFSVES